MLGLEIPELKDIFHGDLGHRADWLVANLDTSISWPVRTQKVSFRGFDFWLIPVTKQSYPAVALKLSGQSTEEGQRKLLRFLSALSWHQDSGITVASFTGGNLPRPMGREKSMGLIITAELDLTGLVEPETDQAKLALALMREGRALNHPGYAFLSFYRVLEVCLSANERKTWLSENAERIEDRRGKEALQILKTTEVGDVGEHLYRSGRHAIAHASQKPIIDPDEPADSRRLRAELPIMKALAELAIETELGVNTPHTEWRQHLYELAGFKRLLGEDVVRGVLEGKEPEDGAVIDLPPIDVEIRRRGAYLPLQKLNPIYAGQVEKSLQVVFESADSLVRIEFVLDFREERLRFDWHNGVFAGDDGSAKAARNAAELTRFLKDYFGNGELHIYDSETRDLLSRVDGFIPVNFWPDTAGFDAKIEQWERKAAEREKATAV